MDDALPAEHGVSAHTRWTIRLLGELRAEQADQVVCRFPTQKTAALLAYLAYYLDRSHPREKLIEVLWPESEPAAGRGHLSWCLTKLRRLLEPHCLAGAVISADRFSVRLSAAAATTDVAEFQADLRCAQAAPDDLTRLEAMARAVERYQGELLPGFYEPWIAPEQERWAESYLQALRELTSLLEARGDLDRALHFAQLAVTVDRLSEEARREVIRLQIAAGRTTAARRHYAQMEQILKEELGVSPSATSRELLERIGETDTLWRPSPPHPAASSPPPLHNLPHPLTSFIGRTRESEEIRRLLAQTRLLTLVGPGGCGKSRLALDVGASLVNDRPNGVWLVEMAPLADPTLVPKMLASALGIGEDHRPLTETLVERLKPQSLLLLLDNCEHLLPACAHLVELLLKACPGLSVLATSREGLAIPGEICYPVPSLPTPDPDQSEPMETLLGYEAVRLLLDRIRWVAPAFEVTAPAAVSLAQICHRLEGIPLALELAAARTKALSLEQIAARLNDPLGLLTGGSRTGLPRHQTLRATLDWSHALLSDAEQEALRRFAVFSGGWTLEAAEAVSGDRSSSAAHRLQRTDAAGHERRTVSSVLDVLTQLVDKSLVQVRRSADGEPRFGMLETIRQYGLERLESSGEMAATKWRHVRFFLAVAETMEPMLYGREGPQRLDQMDREHGNFRAALEWCASCRAPALQMRDAGRVGLRLAGALSAFWHMRSHQSEGLHWLEGALAHPGAEGRTPARAKALHSAGNLVGSQNRYGAAQVWHERSAALYRELGDRLGLARALKSLGSDVLWKERDYTTTRSLLEESLAILRELGEKRDIGQALCGLGIVARLQGDFALARPLYEESAELFRAVDDRLSLSVPLSHLGLIAMEEEDYATARSALEERLAISREFGNNNNVATCLDFLGDVACRQGDYERAEALFNESLALWRRIGNRSQIAELLEELGQVAKCRSDYPRARMLQEQSLALANDLDYMYPMASALARRADVVACQGEPDSARALYESSLGSWRESDDRLGVAMSLEGLARLEAGRPERAACLFGAAEALRQEIKSPVHPTDRAQYARAVAGVRATLTDDAFESAWREGRAMTLEQAIELALKEGPAP